MATITPNNIYFYGTVTPTVGSGTVENAWADRLAGTAFVDADPMVGIVVAISLSGPYIVGNSSIDENGAWEITNIPQRFAGTDLIVLGVPNDTTKSIAIASRVQTV